MVEADNGLKGGFSDRKFFEPTLAFEAVSFTHWFSTAQGQMGSRRRLPFPRSINLSNWGLLAHFLCSHSQWPPCHWLFLLHALSRSMLLQRCNSRSKISALSRTCWMQFQSSGSHNNFCRINFASQKSAYFATDVPHSFLQALIKGKNLNGSQPGTSKRPEYAFLASWGASFDILKIQLAASSKDMDPGVPPCRVQNAHSFLKAALYLSTFLAELKYKSMFSGGTCFLCSASLIAADKEGAIS